MAALTSVITFLKSKSKLLMGIPLDLSIDMLCSRVLGFTIVSYNDAFLDY